MISACGLEEAGTRAPVPSGLSGTQKLALLLEWIKDPVVSGRSGWSAWLRDEFRGRPLTAWVQCFIRECHLCCYLEVACPSNRPKVSHQLWKKRRNTFEESPTLGQNEGPLFMALTYSSSPLKKKPCGMGAGGGGLTARFMMHPMLVSCLCCRVQDYLHWTIKPVTMIQGQRADTRLTKEGVFPAVT